MSLIGGLRSFDLIWAMTQGGPGFSSDVLASVIYKQYQAGFYGLSTAGNVVLFLLISAIVVPWDTLFTSVVLYIVIPVILAQVWRKSLLAKGQAAFDAGNGQVVAAQLLVVLHPKLGVQAFKFCPVAPLAQQQQPVVAQAVFLVGAAPALQEVFHLLGRGTA